MLHIERLTKTFPTKPLFLEASAHLKPNTRVGLVGPNGSGKTSIMRMIRLPSLLANQTIQRFLDWSIPAC
jgi:ATPase subunit of ABC transporter with duplicated ATPase domains